MRKKNYIKPEALVVPTEASVILAGSTYIQKAEEADYTDDKIKKPPMRMAPGAFFNIFPNCHAFSRFFLLVSK